MSHESYQNPLISRYASQAMSRVWSPQMKHSTWRRLWVALAEAEQELGLEFTDAQIEELRATVDEIDFENAARHERERRHDVMAHVHAWRDQCPNAGGIVHTGATSCYVTDNSELIQIRESLRLVQRGLVRVIDHLANFAEQWKDLPCLGYTHLQPAQPTTVGKRACLWLWDLVLDLEEIEYRLETLRFRGVKGTTGTQATFLALFDGDHAKVEKLDKLVTEKMGFTARHPVTGQTYSRKIDTQILAALSGIGQSAHKMGSDLRLLQSRKELEEPIGSKQIGSSAMAYKRNPMRAERMCSLSRFAMSLTANGEQTMATQWMERTLDDSANRRLSLPQSFLAIDAVLILAADIVSGLLVFPKMVERNLRDELPFLATEEILMAGVRAGGDRQSLHEVIRVHSHEAAKDMKEQDRPNDLIERLSGSEEFSGVDLTGVLDASRFIGRAPEQVDAFLADVIQPIRSRHASALEGDSESVRV